MPLMSRPLRSADLVPVFSFGENDVRLIAHFSPAAYALHGDDASDLRTNAKRKGHDVVQDPEEVPKRLWLHTSIIPWARDTQL